MHEVVAWRLARSLGPPWDQIVPPSVLRSEAPGGPGAFLLGISGAPNDPAPFTEALGDPVAFWDALVAQQDRHSQNYRWDAATNRLYLLDHGFSFARPGDYLNTSIFLAYRHSEHREALAPREVAILAGLKASINLLGLAEYLEPERAAALASRVDRMFATGGLLKVGVF